LKKSTDYIIAKRAPVDGNLRRLLYSVNVVPTFEKLKIERGVKNASNQK